MHLEISISGGLSCVYIGEFHFIVWSILKFHPAVGFPPVPRVLWGQQKLPGRVNPEREFLDTLIGWVHLYSKQDYLITKTPPAPLPITNSLHPTKTLGTKDIFSSIGGPGLSENSREVAKSICVY
jgi:hypothetical protein